MRTLMASVTRTSGGRIPVDSTVTGREKKHQNHNLIRFLMMSRLFESFRLRAFSIFLKTNHSKQSAKVKEMDVKAAKSNLTKPKGYNA